jgi:hypothetical protein
MSDLRRKILVAALLILAVLLPLWPAFEEAGLSMDEGALLVYPQLMAQGAVPYRDFETFYGPANTWVLAGAYAFTGPNIFAERALGLLYRILILAALFTLVQRRSVTLAAGCVVVGGWLLIPLGLQAYACIGAMACALWSLWCALEVESPRRCFVGGLLAGFALLYRPDFGPAVIAAGLPLFLLMSKGRRWQYLAGAATALLPYAWVTMLAGPREVINNLVLFPVFHSSAGRHLPIFTAPPFLINLFFAHLAAVALNLITGLREIHRQRTDRFARLLLGLGLLALGLTHQAVQRLDAGHLVAPALVSFCLLPLSISLLLAGWRDRSLRVYHAFLVSAAVLLPLQMVAPSMGIVALNRLVDSLDGEVHYAVFVDHQGRSFPVSSPPAALALNDMLNQLDRMATPGQRLFVGPADLRRTNYNDTFIYYLMPQLQPATYFLEMNPLSANRLHSRLAADVATADWLILDHRWDVWDEPNESVKYGSDAPTQVVKNQFQMCGQFGNYGLFRRRPVALSRN